MKILFFAMPMRGIWHNCNLEKKNVLSIYKIIMLAALIVVLMPILSIENAYAEESGDKYYNFSISKINLEKGISDFALQCNIKVHYDERIVTGKETNGISGRLTAQEGLKQLLAGTGLTGKISGDGTLVIVPLGQEKDTVLPTMQVQGAAIGTHEISVDKLRRSMARDMADVFRDDPSLVVGGGARNAQRLYVRGVEATNLNISIDGAKQGGSLHQHRGDIGSIDPTLLKKVSVQTGSSADAGPGALGGSIRFETVDAQDLLESGEKVGAIVRGGYGSTDKSWRGSTTVFGKVSDHFGLMGNFSGLDRRDYAVGGGDEAENTAGEDYDFMLKMSMLEFNNHSLRVSAEHKRDSGLYVWGGAGSDMGYASGADPVYVYTERNSYVVDHRFNPDNPYVDSHINLYYNENSVENRDSNSEYAADTLGGDIRNTFHFAFGSVQNNLTTGLDYVAENNTADASGTDTDNDSHNLGLFLQNRLSWGPTRLSFGARLDEYGAEFGENDIDGSRVSPNVGMEYDLFSGLTAFANYGQAVRASGIIPGSWLANINQNTVFSVEAPETSERYEGGLRFRKNGLLLPTDSLQVEWTYFDSRMKNIITAQGGKGGVVKAIMNSDPLFSKGWEARLGWGIEAFNTSVGYTHVTTRDENGDPVSVTRRLAASTGDRLVWDNRFSFLDSWTFGYTMTYVARLEDVPSGEDERPGYLIHSVQAEWTPEFVPGLTLILAVNNLFDRKYSEQTSIADSDGNVLSEPGRDIRLGFEYRM